MVSDGAGGRSYRMDSCGQDFGGTGSGALMASRDGSGGPMLSTRAVEG